ncbi:hypothetical protein [Metapseudomonas otitidis]|uniref:hypothetical protein n=1 Tax=Metapseudomonas otitidis TaxID=319939 RepID=UPI0013F68BC3|nr:hypothetical protein [Pseudomonas otitidis]
MNALAERDLPSFQFVERHHLDLDTSAAQALDAASQLSTQDAPLVKALLRLREAPARLAHRLGWRNTLESRPPFDLHELTLLERDGNQAMAYGLIGRFWRTDFGLEPVPDAQAFIRHEEPRVARLVMTFHCSARPEGVRQHTETRVRCPDRRQLANAA